LKLAAVGVTGCESISDPRDGDLDTGAGLTGSHTPVVGSRSGPVLAARRRFLPLIGCRPPKGGVMGSENGS